MTAVAIAASNTYAYGTRIQSSGAPPGPVIVLPQATLGTGNVDAASGMLVLTDPRNISSNATLRWNYQITVSNRAKIRVASAIHNNALLPPGVYNSSNRPSILGDGSIRTPGTNIPPAVVVTAPGNGMTVRDDEPVRFSVQPSDVDGFIERVEFYVSGYKVGERTTAPYSITLTNPPIGTHLLHAVVFDDDGGSKASPTVTLRVRTRVAVQSTAHGFVLQFPVSSNAPYTLQVTDVLPPVWSNVMHFAPGSERTVFYTNTAVPPPPARFYRVVGP